MPGPPVVVSGASRIAPHAAAATPAPTAKTLLDSLKSTRIIRLTDHEMRVAVIMLRLSGRRDIVLSWIRLLQLQKWRWKRGLAHLVTTEVLEMWCERFAHDPIVVRCLAEPHACVRGAVHIFLLQSVPAECVQDCVRAGCSSLQASFWGSTWRFCPRCRHAPWLMITGPAWSAMCTRRKVEPSVSK